MTTAYIRRRHPSLLLQNSDDLFLAEPAPLHLVRLIDEDRTLLINGGNLGSGLIDHSQKMMVAARQMAEKKVWAQRS